MKIKKLILKKIQGKVQIVQTDVTRIIFDANKLFSRTTETQMVIEEKMIHIKNSYKISIPADLEELEIQYCDHCRSLNLKIDMISLYLRDNQYCNIDTLDSKKTIMQLSDESVIVIHKINITHLILITMNMAKVSITSGVIKHLAGNIGLKSLCEIQSTIVESHLNASKVLQIKNLKKQEYLKFETPYREDNILYYGKFKIIIPKQALDESLRKKPITLSENKKIIYLNAYEYHIDKEKWEFIYGFGKGIKSFGKEIVIGCIAISLLAISIKNYFKKNNQEAGILVFIKYKIYCYYDSFLV